MRVRAVSTHIDIDRIDGKPRTVRDLFTGRKYRLDYFQREYAWTRANVAELIDDLSTRFLDSWDEAHEPGEVVAYRPYFLGPIVTNNRAGLLFLVDGQQRLTTLTLLLIYLHHLQSGRPEIEPVDVKPFVVSTQLHRYSFNLDFEDRRACMDALLQGVTPVISDGQESSATLWARYQDIGELFPQELKGKALPYFVDWMLERVAVVEITTSDQDMALEIFETMNDRGLRLTTTDMLKSYLLAMIRQPDQVDTTNQVWRAKVSELAVTADKGDSDFIRNWLRAKYAETIRERRKDAIPGDFDIIGTAPHKWVRDHREWMGLRKPSDFMTLITRDFDRLSDRYVQLLRVSQHLTDGFEEVFYNAWNGFTFQYPLILAALSPADDEATFQLKTRLVAGWADIFLSRRMVNYRNFGYSTVAYTMFNLIKEIRDLDLIELRDVLSARIVAMEDGWAAVADLSLHQRNSNQIKYLLARITAWLEGRCEGTLTFADLVSRKRKHPFEIEHIWSNHPEEHQEVATTQAFSDLRNRFGGLLLLPKDFNASYGDATYEKKLPHYLAQNILARSLHPQCYQNNPTFLKLVADRNLPFAPVEQFTTESFEVRQQLYRRLCEEVWDPIQVGLDVPVDVGLPEEQDSQLPPGVGLKHLLAAGLLHPGQVLVGTRAGASFSATVTADGKIKLATGIICEAPSAAAALALDTRACNGWTFWHASTPQGLVRISRLRDTYLNLHK